MKKFLNGFDKFKTTYTNELETLAQKQTPYAIVVACCDSRVAPELLFDAAPGELFVVRNVANIVPPYEKDGKHHGTSAALEFGIRFLHLNHLIILGHSNCAGITSLLNADFIEDDEFISSWVSLLKKSSDLNYSVDDYAKESLTTSYQHCLEFPWIQERIQKKNLTIHRWFFDIPNQSLLFFNDKTNLYEKIS